MEGGGIVLARILFVSDLHKRYRDSSSIKGTLKAQQAVQEDLIHIIEQNGITHAVIMGDWYDRGFHGIGQAYGAIEMDRRLSEAVGGEIYLCVGNHLYLERDENPELYICQPNDYIKPQLDIPLPEKPIFKLVPELRIGDVLISFFHFSKINKNYITFRPEDITTHIGVYHDAMCVPGYVAEMDGFQAKSSQTYLNDVYRNVDIAMHGHIHSKVGAISLELVTGKKVPMFIPGSLGITSNKECFKHPFVQLPVIEIEDDSTVKAKLVKVSTHMEMLRFYEVKRQKKEIIKDADDATFVANRQLANSLQEFLVAKGHGPTQLRLVDAAAQGLLNLGTTVAILQEVIDNGL